MENVIAWEIAQSFMEKFGGDSFEEIKNNLDQYRKQVESY
jgi:chorismate synthase